MTAQARRTSTNPATPTKPRTRAPAARPAGARAANPRPALAVVAPAPTPTATPQENPRRKKGRKGRRRGRKHNPRKTNPVASTLGILAVGAAAATVGYFGYRAYARKRALNKPLGESLSSILKPGATLAEVPFIVDDVQQPVALAITTPPPKGYSLVSDIVVHAPGTLGNNEPISLRNVEFGSGVMGTPNDLMWEGRDLSGKEVQGVAAEGVSQAVGSLVTNVNPEFARQVYERVLTKVAAGGNWEDDHDEMIKAILGQLAPSVDWTQGLAPYVRGDAASRVWSAVQSIGAVAAQSYFNKQALAETSEPS